MKKRLMSILLVMTMIFSMFPTTAFAEEGGATTTTPTEYTVKYMLDDTNTYVVMRAVNGYVQRPTAPVKAGYDFEKWVTRTTDSEGATTESDFDFGTAITAETTLYAKFTQNNNWYTVNFVAGGKHKGSQTIQHNAVVYEPECTVDGYTIEGWYTENGTTDPETGTVTWDDTKKFTFGTTLVTGSITLYAKLTAIDKVNISYADGLTGVTISSMPTGGEVLPNTDYMIPNMIPTAAGYTFKGWKIGEDTTKVYQPGYTFTPTENTTITAQWEKIPVEHKVTFARQAADADATNWPNNITFTDTDTDVKIPYQAPQMEGRVFQGWTTTAGGTTEETDYAPGKTVTTGVTLYAVWADKMVSITWPGTTETPTGVVLSGTIPTSVAQNTRVSFTVTLENGYDPTTLVVCANGAPLAATNVNENIYTYSFLAKDDTVITIGNQVAKKQYTIALPQSDNCTVVFGEDTAVNAAKGLTSYTFEYGDEFTVEVTPKKDYTAVLYVNGKPDANFSTTDDDGTSTAKPVREKTASAKYKAEAVTDIRVDIDKVQFFTVTYVVDGAQLTTRQVEKGTAVNTLKDVPIPDKEGYTASAWYTDKEYTALVTEQTGNVTDDMEIYAKYDPKQYAITYNKNTTDTVNGMPNPESIIKKHGQAVQLSDAVPTREGYTFMGWAMAENIKVAVYQPGDTVSVDKAINLYAVWAVKTYKVTINAGQGCTVHYSQDSLNVAHGTKFEFSVIVDAEYREHTPEIWVHETGNSIGHNDWLNCKETHYGLNGTTSNKYLYETRYGVTSDLTININIARNAKYTVTFEYANDLTGIYETQQVEWNQKATQPNDPEVEGYTFKGWYTNSDCSDGNEFSFDTPIKNDTTVYAKMVKKQYTVTLPTPAANDGWSIEFTEPTGSSPLTVDHGTKVTFTVTVKEGYDASAMQVGVNGKLWAADSVVADGNNTVYTYTIPAVTEHINVTVVGVVRKTVTITYMPNAKDDTDGWWGQEKVNYYISGTSVTDNGTITGKQPTRTGYEFLGWSLDMDRKPDEFNNSTYADRNFVAGDTATFTTDTVLYAIWKAESLTVKLDFESEYYFDPYSTSGNGEGLHYFYEGDQITLTGTLSTNAKGDMVFYKKLYSEADSAWVKIGTSTVNGGKVGSLTTTVEPYKTESGKTLENAMYRWEYKVEFEPDADEGFSACSAKDDIRVYSKAISWRRTSEGAVNSLAIYTNEACTTEYNAAMQANTVYWLKIPNVVEMDGGRSLKNGSDVLTVGNDYEVIWQYKDANNDWVTKSTISNSNVFKVEAEYSQYSFRALVKPTEASIYTKAAKFNYDTDNKLVDNQYQDYLYTKPTAAVARKTTTTDLEIVNTDGKLTESKDVAVNGAKPFANDAADHLAQFEGQTITLKATVKEKDAGGKVDAGGVYFYRWDGTTATKLNDKLAPVDSNGVAELTNVVVKAYDTKGDKTAINNVDQFYAVYQTHETWETSDSRGTDSTAYQYANVYIKSTSIKTPIIDSALAGTDDKTATTYTEDLNGLLAGVEHKFTLRQTGADTGVTADWSVVALDGRTVADKNYDIQWLVKTGSNEQNADNDSTAVAYVVENSKFGDQYRVKLIAKGDMKVDAYSNYAIIGTKQDVTVTVTARDEIATTPETDVYQLNEITLTATVVGANDDATNKPTGTVTFYYSVDNGANWTQIGKATDLAKKDGSDDMIATITTDQLPVKAVDNTKQNVKISALYSGDKTFNAITEQNDTKITQEEVTVYSSVVYVSSIENTTDTGSRKQDGIYISVVEGALLNNESSVTLKLSDVYTLDYNDTLAETVAKLKFDTDYEVEWQILENAAAFSSNYAAAANWQAINGKTGNTCELSVKQGAAYRAKITVKDTAIAKGSFTEVDQTVAGRKVYYSNILVAASAPSTLTVNVNTEKTDAGWEGIVEGEKVTIHTFTAGGSSTPISTLTAKITKQGSDEVVFEATKNDVNGHASFEWKTGADYAGYYTLTVTATYNNGYSDKTITRTLIVRDNDYSFTVSGDNTTYNGKAQGLTVKVNGMDIEPKLADDSVVVYYYDEDGKQVEPTQAGTYTAKIRLQESAYWTEKTIETTFTIAKREVKVVDLVAQAKVYDGTTNANILEIILNDAETDQTTTGLPKKTETTGIINGDSVYAVGTGYTTSANAGTVQLKVKNVVLAGDDKDNYVLVDASYDEDFNIQRSQVKGDIANSTFLYTGSNITVPADDIYLIDQAGNVLGADQYTVTYYYHNGDGVEKVSAMNKLGKYTVIARPDQSNYKGGASETIYVVSENPIDAAPSTDFHSALINISNTVELYGAADNKGIVASATNGANTTVTYWNGSNYVTDRPTDAGRYLVKVTTDTNDTAYGIYTIVKANPVLTLNAENVTYNSAQQKGYKNGTYNGSDFPTGTYYSYTGGTIQGVSYTAPTEAGTYVVTAHVPETDNYTAHEVSATFTIARKALTITADDLRRQQYGEYPDMVATFEGLATEGVAPDTSLRDVQIQPEMVFDTGYTNSANDQVGTYTVTPVAALARNYTITYKSGSISVTNTAERELLAIHGMIDNGDSTKNIAYYGDVIQLYAYGTQNADKTINTDSSVLEWSVTNPSKQGHATITQDGLLTITGVGTFTVTLKRGVGTAQVSTSIEITALQQEVKVIVPNVDKVYSGTSQSHDQAATSVSGKLVHISDALNSKTKKDAATESRTDIGSQIVTAKVEGAVLYQSETYGGLFTINDKDVTVKPGAQDTVYGTKEGYEATKYTEDGSYTGKPALSDAGVASIADAYGNLDVLDGYEILVAGTEDMNYNVKYLTKKDTAGAEDVKVNYLALTVKTGTLNNQVGMTSGSLNPVGSYPVNGTVVTPDSLTQNTTRMYGEPNWVMDYNLVTLIDGDSMADLMGEPGKLVNYAYGIGADANVKYDAKDTKLTGKSDYYVDTDSTMIAFGNYTESYTKGIQNIYQRPVTLALNNAQDKLRIYYADILDGGTLNDTKLLNIILNNVEVDKYNMEGGLATLLKHTVKDLDLKITTDYSAGGDSFTATVTIGNQNYWLGNSGEKFEIPVEIVPQRLTVSYDTYTQTYTSVTLYQESASGKTAAYASGDVTLYIYEYVEGEDAYSYYAANETAVVTKKLTKDVNNTGRYYVSYDQLANKKYRFFVVASGYTIID